MKRLFALALTLGASLLAATAQDAPPAIPDDWVEVKPGELPIIVTAPHGGPIRPESIPDRPTGTFANDRFAGELAREVARALESRLGAAPSLVVCNVHRRKVDCNREIGEAAQGNPEAEAIWHKFQDGAAAACKAAGTSWGAGLLVDIHGHGHPIKRSELGYLLGGRALNLSDQEIDADPEILKESSIRELAGRSGQSLSALLRGPASLGALLEKRGVACVPSPANPSPEKNPHFSGGYNTDIHGSRRRGTVSALQIETPSPGARATVEDRRRFAQALAEALDDYFLANFKIDLKKEVAARKVRAAAVANAERAHVK